MAPSLLITQCLQNDFVKPLDRYEPLPNLLHIGHDEARRLMGENPEEGPVQRLMDWAYRQDDERLSIVHIRDWHSLEDPAQAAHLEQFGAHCLQTTPGAEFAFAPPANGKKNVAIVDSLHLNDFLGTPLAGLLARLEQEPTRVGLVGVWTEAKVTFLAYELATRYPQVELGVCSALTASSSTARHFLALDQLERLLGLKVFSSVGRFLTFLGGEEASDLAHPALESRFPEMGFEPSPPLYLSPTDTALARHLFRDCRRVSFRTLDGGYSGNVVLGSTSFDLFGHQQAPHVVKIGPQELIGRERTAFERIEAVLGNNAPRIADFADLAERGAIKYRYASMGGGFSTTFQKRYMAGLDRAAVERILRRVFVEQLGKLYAAGEREKCDLLEHYGFSTRWAGSVRRKVESLTGAPAEGPTLSLPEGHTFPNLCRFYEEELAELPRERASAAYLAYLHGDLNGANIVIDAQDNVWLIDFFHAHRGHILKDLIKLENDLLYIFTPLESRDDLEEALRLSEFLFRVEDLARPFPPAEAVGLSRPALVRCFETVALLRSFYPPLIRADRDPLQLFIGALRYAVHTLSFDESSDLQKKWALLNAGSLSAEISRRLRASAELRVDWLGGLPAAKGSLGITLLPGRRDQGRELASDLAALARQGVTDVVCLATSDELQRFGVPQLLTKYAEAGISSRHLPVLDQGVPHPMEARELVSWMQVRIAGGGRLVVHCVGGLGRAGTVAACFLKSSGLGTPEALEEVRRARSARAIETEIQEEFVRGF